MEEEEAKATDGKERKGELLADPETLWPSQFPHGTVCKLCRYSSKHLAP